MWPVTVPPNYERGVADVRDNTGNTASHRFGHRVGKAFTESGGQRRHVKGAVDRWHVLPKAGIHEASAQPQGVCPRLGAFACRGFARPQADEEDVWALERNDFRRAQEGLMVLLRIETANQTDHAVTGGDPPFGPDSRTAPGIRRKDPRCRCRSE